MRSKVLFFLLIGLCAVPARATPILSFSPSSPTVVAGQLFSLDITVANAVDLYGYEFSLGFNPTVLSATAITEGPLLGTAGPTFFIPGTIDNVGGSIAATGDLLLTALAGVNGNGVIARVQFNALAAGTSPLSLFDVTLLDSQLSGIPTIASAGTVNVTAAAAATVPEPSTIVLLCSGLTGLRQWRRRRFLNANL